MGDILPVATIPDWLGQRAASVPNKLAIVASDAQFTYQGLHDAACRYAASLRALTEVEGHPVAVLMKDTVQYALLFHALMQAGAVVVPLNWRLASVELAKQLTDCRPSLFIFDEEASSLAKQSLAYVDDPIKHVAFESIRPTDERFYRQQIQLCEPHAMIYTSGTTGAAKGAVLTYQNHWWGAMASAMQLGLSLSDRWLVPMPLFHVGGMAVLVRSLIYGTTVVIHRGFHPEAVNHAIDEAGVTLVSVVPAMLQRMLDGRDRPYPQTLRSVLLGGSAAPKALLSLAHELQVPVNQSYGMTETNTQATTLTSADALRKVGSSGKPLANLRLAIAGPTGVTDMAGVEGEIVVQGPTVIKGYYNRPDANAQAFRDGWFYTGDIGVLDDEGYLYVLDRRSDLIVSGGENVYPAEVESTLSESDSVAQAAVVGRQDDAWGQVPVAFVVLEPGFPFDRQAIIEHCKMRLASYKVPKEIYAVDALPRNASGKLLRRALKERLLP